MRLPPNARRFRGRPPVEEDDPLLAYRRARGQGGTTVAPVVDTTTDPLTRFRAKYSGMDPIDVRPVSSESTSTRSPAPTVARPTIGPRVLEPETEMERGMGRAEALYQGLTFGTGDKIQAGIKTLLPEVMGGSKGWDFRENLRNARTPLNDYRVRHPIESTAAEIAGSLPTVMASAPLSISARLAEAPAVARIAGLMGEGGVMGGTVGALDAIQPGATPGDVGRGAAAGAATGAVAAPLVAPVVSGIMRGATRLGARALPASIADRVAGFMGGEPVTPRGQAKAGLTGALEAGGVNPAEAAKTTGLIPPFKPKGDAILSALDEAGIPIAPDGTVEVFISGEPGKRITSLVRPTKGSAVSMRVSIDNLDAGIVERSRSTALASGVAPNAPRVVAPHEPDLPFESHPDLPELPSRVGASGLPRDARAPRVEWNGSDLQEGGPITPASLRKTYGNKGVIYQSYIPAEDIPSAKGAGIDADMNAYDWSELRSGRGAPPPIKVRITPEGKIELLDGNHRASFWSESGKYDHIPAWVIDERPGIHAGGSSINDAAVRTRLGNPSGYHADNVAGFAEELHAAGARVSPDGTVQLHYVGTPEEVARFRQTGQMADDELLRLTPPKQGETGASVRVPIEKLDLDHGIEDGHVALLGGTGTTDASSFFAGRAKPASGTTPMGGRTANTDILRIADEYRKASGVSGEALEHPAKVDAEKAGVMAHAYEALKNDPKDPEVIAAYRALAKETRAQADALMAAGYKPEFMTDDPYKNSAEMMKDLADRKTIRVFKTNKANPHPLLSDEENDLFRWVHDIFGHAQSGNQFGALGEERAFRDHASMFSPLARRAMATETRGQNSWVNFGPNADLPAASRPYAEQKAAVMPRELTGDYGNIPRESPTTMMEMGSRQVPALVRAARNVPTSSAAQVTDRFVTERAAGAGKRIERALNEATGHQATDTWMPVEQIIETRANEANPLYKKAESYGEIKNPETIAQIKLLRRDPVFARMWTRGQALGRLESGEAAATGDAAERAARERLGEVQLGGPGTEATDVSQRAPTIREINRWKKGLDATIESGFGSENALSRDEARVYRRKLNDVLAMVDKEARDFQNARRTFAGHSELKDAAEAGAEHFKPSTPTGALARQLAEMSPGEREVYTANGLNKLVEKIRTVAVNPDMPEAGRSTNILQRIMGTEDASERLGMLFPDEKSFETFLKQVEDEALYPKTDRFLRGQSTTKAQIAESGVPIKTWADLAKSPFSKSARFRLVRNLMSGAMADEPLPPKVANEVAELATTTGYRLRALLQEMAADKAGREAGRRRLLSFSNAALAGGTAPTAAEVERRRRTPPNEGR